MTQNPKRQKLFDEWAKSYDQDLEDMGILSFHRL
jgi:hypothetical protein